MPRPRLRLLPGSERARLTALYGALLLLAGGGLVALVYTLVREGLFARVSGAVQTVSPGYQVPGRGADIDVPGLVEPARQLPPDQVPDLGDVKRYAFTQNLSTAVTDAMLSRLLWVSLVALAVFAVLSILLAWWMAGRVLRPVGVITETARRLSGENLHERIGLKAPPGELKRLADTFDGMLGRMEDLVCAQRRFAANAAHELRTPLAVQRAAAEIGLAGEPGPERVGRIRAKLIGVADDSERLIEGLLLLAVSGQGLEATEAVELDRVVTTEADACAEEADAGGVTVHRDLSPVTVHGEPVLLGHLVRNLLANALRHNRDGGRVDLRTDGRELVVVNTGPVVPPADVPRLLEPFGRRAERQHTPGEGAGLGLSIVASIARAHGADLLTEANPAPDGGLTVRVRFPSVRDPGA
ncbi:ATP-binding protein [Streptomyces olivoreticuli]|uniref:ATP-binding protein n=1 Tax=Streptomyces olivoreticuli TaxID=68246 RepID=UPI00265AF80B|nr:ATP-binding protein [Streptomyces olivoreticuli]WKK24499.1 ATP-binding protein [Streptomyces olivoreticuli]